MRIDVWLSKATAKLQQADIKTARLDCLVLLESVMGRDRSNLLAHPELTLSLLQMHRLNKLIAQRVKHVPLAYIRGQCDFFGRTFHVNKNVLVPRPETEAVVELLKQLKLSKQPHIADIGTGSGCIGITAALEIPGSHVDFYDIDARALAVARRNAHSYGLTRSHFFRADAFTPKNGPYEVVLTNLPYVPIMYPINQAAEFEPRIALFSGTDGLDHYRKFWAQIELASPSERPIHIIAESFTSQHWQQAQLARTTGYTVVAVHDFAQQFIRSSTGY